MKLISASISEPENEYTSACVYAVNQNLYSEEPWRVQRVLH